jgi:hypothetical protein
MLTLEGLRVAARIFYDIQVVEARGRIPLVLIWKGKDGVIIDG